jgi:hypothetical protein
LFKSPKLSDWISDDLLDELVYNVQALQVTSTRKQEFRVSSLPMCPLLDISKKHDQGIETQEDYSSHFYFSSGNNLHTLFQKFASQKSSLIGNWRCERMLSTMNVSNPPSETFKKCNQKYEFCSLKSAIKNHSCPHKLKDCKKPNLTYVELAILHDGLSGHVDLLFCIDGVYYLLDIKTTNDRLFTDTKKELKKGYYPASKYHHQIETYACLLEKKYNIKISKYAILYVSRSTPSSRQKKMHLLFTIKFTKERRAARMNLIDSQIANHKLVLKFNKNPTEKLLTKIWKQRPCQTKLDYKNIMSSKFFGRQQCEFYKDGSCFSGKIVKDLIDKEK